MKLGFSRIAACTALLAAAVAAPAAWADAPAEGDAAAEARQQYNAGTQAYAAKRFVEAALHFEAAAAQRAHAVTLYTAALAWEQANRPERAADDFVRALDVPGLNATQAANAHERVASLEKTLGTLSVTVADGTAPWRVQLDALTEVTAPARLHALPGVHALNVRTPDGQIAKRDVTLNLGEATPFVLNAEAFAPPPAAPPPPAPVAETKRAPTEPEAPLRRMLGVGVVGLGVATLGATIVLGVNALGARDAYDAAPTQAAYDHASSLQTWTNVALVSGVALTAAGAALVLWPAASRSEAARVSVAPGLGGAVVRGRF